MPQPKIPDHWRNYVKRVLSQHDGQISDRRVSQLLKVEADRLRDDPDFDKRALADIFPSERTIGRIRKEEWSLMTEADKAHYREFYWPESMERGDLPWEAAPYALEYLRHRLHDTKMSNGQPSIRPPVIRPTNEAILWFWKVSMAAPTAPFRLRNQIATYLTWLHLQRPVAEIFELFLAHTPWENRDRKAEYLAYLDLTIAGTGENPTMPELLRRAYEAGLDVDLYFQLFEGIADTAEAKALKEEYFEISVEIRRDERLNPLLASIADEAEQEALKAEFSKIVMEERNQRLNQPEV